MDSIIASMNNNQDLEDKDMEDQDIIESEDSNKKSGGGQVSSFLKFSIHNILQHAAQASNGSSSAAAAAAAVAAAASAAAVRRSTASDLMSQAEVAAAITDFDMKRAMGSLPFW